MSQDVFEYVCVLHGWRSSLLNIHWDAQNMSQHKLCDDISDDLKEFVAISQTDEQLQFYRERATQLANSFLDRSMKEELNADRERLERDFLRDYKNHGFWYGVWQSIVASFLFLVIGYLLLVATGSWDKLLARL